MEYEKQQQHSQKGRQQNLSPSSDAKDGTGAKQRNFLEDLWNMVDDDRNYPNLSWQPGGDGFIVKDRRLVKEYVSFRRNLDRWGFKQGISFRSSEELCAAVAAASPAPQEREYWHHEENLFCREDAKKKFALLRSIAPKDTPSPGDPEGALKDAQDDADEAKEKSSKQIGTTKEDHKMALDHDNDNDDNNDDNDNENDDDDDDDDYYDDYDDDDYCDDDDDDEDAAEEEVDKEEDKKNQPAPVECVHVPVLKRPNPSGKGTYRVPIMQEEILEKSSKRFWTIVKDLGELHFRRQLILQGYNPEEPDADNVDLKVATMTYSSFFDQLVILHKMSYLPPLPKNYNRKPVNFGETFRFYFFVQDEFAKEMRRDPNCENPQDPAEKVHLASSKERLKRKLQDLLDSHFWEEKEERQDDFVSTVAAMNAFARQLEILKRISFRGQH